MGGAEHTMNEVLNTLGAMTLDEKKELICFLDFLISAQETQEPQADSPG